MSANALANTNPSNFLPQNEQQVESLTYKNASLTGYQAGQNGEAFGVQYSAQYGAVEQLYNNPISWAGYDGVVVCLTNQGGNFAHVIFRFDTVPHHGPSYGSGGIGITLQPHCSGNFLLWFNPTAGQYGYRQCLPDIDMPTSYVPGTYDNINLATIYDWMISNNDTNQSQVWVSGLFLVHKMNSFNGLIDPYGQDSLLSYPGKISSDSQLTQNLNTELSSLPNQPVIAQLDGSTSLPNMGATGRWQLKKSSKGSWFFVTPDGHPFWSLGVNELTYDMATRLDGRQPLFQALPPDNQQEGSPYGTMTTCDGQNVNTVNFLISNMETAWSASWLNNFLNETSERLPRWGFNTVGGWSMPNFMNNSMPYTTILATDSFPTRLHTPYQMWRPLPDPFATTFQSWMQTNFASTLQANNGKSNFMGVFVDNEQSWCEKDTPQHYYQIPIAALNAGANQPANRAFCAMIEKKYGSIGALNTAWGTSIASWSSFNNTNALGTPATINSAMAQDFSAMITSFAIQYYFKVRAALRADGCTALYLGSRNMLDYTPNEVFTAATMYVDCNSVNVYHDIDTAFQYLSTLGRPVLISEFAYAAIDRGHDAYGNPIEVLSQTDRATAIANYLSEAVAQKNFVGVHYFEYVDQPVMGRAYDDARINYGLIDITNTPYSDVVNVFKSFGANMYSLH